MAPKIVFIIPYRDRYTHRVFFSNYMKIVLKDMPEDEYEIYFSHQKDKRPFNRGAVKNIGFLAIREKYPNEYKDITFVFNDVDIVPYTSGIINYATRPGIVKHFYGFNYALGGLFSITGGDFERTNGFPNMWFWGQEDTTMNDRTLRAGLSIRRDIFFPIGHPSIIQLFDGMTRLCSRKQVLQNENFYDGLSSIRNTRLEIVDQDINIEDFDVGTDPAHLDSFTRNITEPIIVPKRRVGMMGTLNR